MLPLSLLKTAINHPMLVELKNGETYNGHLTNCDAWMNIYLTQVICTSRDGDRFWKMAECYIRGSTIKYLRISDEVIENYKEDSNNRMSNMNRRGGGGDRRNNAGGGRQGGGRQGNNNRGGFNQNRQNNQNRNQNMSSSGNSSMGGSTNSLSAAPRPAKQQRR